MNRWLWCFLTFLVMVGLPRNHQTPVADRFKVFVGDASTLSCLKLIREAVEESSGPSPFTTDENRHRMVETWIEVPEDVEFKIHKTPPTQEMATLLVDYFFTNVRGLLWAKDMYVTDLSQTIGFVEIFDRQHFLALVRKCYDQSTPVSPPIVFLLQLVCAIGLVVANPAAGSRDEATLRPLLSNRAIQAESFFNDARKNVCSTSAFEDPQVVTIQGFLLITLYMLHLSRRNAAYAYLGEIKPPL